jgi:hypothetical protein
MCCTSSLNPDRVSRECSDALTDSRKAVYGIPDGSYDGLVALGLLLWSLD